MKKVTRMISLSKNSNDYFNDKPYLSSRKKHIQYSMRFIINLSPWAFIFSTLPWCMCTVVTQRSFAPWGCHPRNMFAPGDWHPWTTSSAAAVSHVRHPAATSSPWTPLGVSLIICLASPSVLAPKATTPWLWLHPTIDLHSMCRSLPPITDFCIINHTNRRCMMFVACQQNQGEFQEKHPSFVSN